MPADNIHVLSISYFQGFGRKNPSKIRQREKEEKQRAEQQDCGAEEESGNPREERRQQSADERDKEEKDKGRSWKAKFGLVSS